MTLVKGKANAYEKKDKAVDKKAGVKENSKRDVKMDAKAVKKSTRANPTGIDKKLANAMGKNAGPIKKGRPKKK